MTTTTTTPRPSAAQVDAFVALSALNILQDALARGVLHLTPRHRDQCARLRRLDGPVSIGELVALGSAGDEVMRAEFVRLVRAVAAIAATGNMPSECLTTPLPFFAIPDDVRFPVSHGDATASSGDDDDDEDGVDWGDDDDDGGLTFTTYDPSARCGLTRAAPWGGYEHLRAAVRRVVSRSGVVRAITDTLRRSWGWRARRRAVRRLMRTRPPASGACATNAPAPRVSYARAANGPHARNGAVGAAIPAVGARPSLAGDVQVWD